MNRLKKMFYSVIVTSMIMVSTVNVAVAKEDVSDTGFDNGKYASEISLLGSYMYQQDGKWNTYVDEDESYSRTKYNNSSIYIRIDSCRKTSWYTNDSKNPEDRRVGTGGKVYVDTMMYDKTDKKDVYCGWKDKKSTQRRREVKEGAYFLTNWAYEMQGQSLVKLKFTNTSVYNYKIKGQWSPDSCGNYTVLN